MAKYLNQNVIETLYQNRKLLALPLIDPEQFRYYKNYMRKNSPNEFAKFEDLNLRLQILLKSQGANIIYPSHLTQFAAYEGSNPAETGYIKLIDSPELASFFNENIEAIISSLKKLQVSIDDANLKRIPEGLNELSHHLEAQEGIRDAQVKEIAELKTKQQHFLGLPNEQQRKRVAMINSANFIDPLKKLEKTIKAFKNNSVIAFVSFTDIEQITAAKRFDDRGLINFPESGENTLFIAFKKMKEFASEIDRRIKKIKPTPGQRLLYLISNPIAKLLKKINVGEGKGFYHDIVNENDYLQRNLSTISEQLDAIEKSEYYNYLKTSDDIVSANIRLTKIDRVISGIKLDIVEGNKMLTELKKNHKEEKRSEPEEDREGRSDQDIPDFRT